MEFSRLAPRKSEGAAPVRGPRAVIVTDDGLGLAVAERDLVGNHDGILLPIRRTETEMITSMVIGSCEGEKFLGLLGSGCESMSIGTGVVIGCSTHDQQVTQIPGLQRDLELCGILGDEVIRRRGLPALG
jgi:hypothetical protein